jgi:hypothetical protein
LGTPNSRFIWYEKSSDYSELFSFLAVVQFMSNDYSTAHEQVKRQLHVITFKTGDLIARSRPILSSLIHQLFLLIPTKIAANMQSRFLQRRDLSN